MQIWDLDYLSSSDEEDNDDESSSSDSDEEEKPKKKRRTKVQDVVDKLLLKDPKLSKLDIEARLRKLKMKHQMHTKICKLPEVTDL
jgi:hypothetical protein